MIKKQFNLRDYQIKFMNDIRVGVKRDKRILAVSATGSGKTKTFISIADNARLKGKTVLILSDSTRIFKQIADEITCTYINPDAKNVNIILNGHVYLAMAQTLMRRNYLINQLHLHGKNLLIITDEAHVGTATNILLALPDALLIGFTATPVGRHLQHIYNGIVIGPQAHELVLNGYLCGYRHFVRRRANLSNLQIGANGEYTDKSQEQVFEDRIVYDGLIEDLRTIPFKKGIIFCGSINDCADTVNQLRANGFNCVPVHSAKDGVLTDKESQYNWFQFTNTLIPLCVGVNSLTKGIDYPPIDLIGLKLKTTSLAKYGQMIGRASRPLDHEKDTPVELRTKKSFTVLDYGENIIHKPWDWAHDWANMWNKPYKEKGDGLVSIKMCPNCDYVCSLNARICDNCGHSFTLDFDNADNEPPPSVLQEVTHNYTNLVGKKIGELTPIQLAAYAKEKNQTRFAMRVARARAQSDPEYIIQFGRAMNYHHGWATRLLNDLPIEPIAFNNIELR